MENHTIKLNKGATAVSIRQYFEGILYLQSKNETPFPIDLDTVWQLAYTAKNKAVECLKVAFTEGIDYKALNQKVEAGPGTSTKIKYYLTVPAMEWFVARRVPQVFEVYRSVFHASAKKALPSADSQYLTGLIGSPLVVNNTNYWPYNLVMVSAGYKTCPNRLYQFANRNIESGMKLFSDETPMFIREYGRVWARAEVFAYLAKRRDAWVALNDANNEFQKLLA